MSQVAEVSLTADDLVKLGVLSENPYEPPKFDNGKIFKVEFSDACRCNVSDEDILKQVAVNIRRGLPQVRPHSLHPSPALLVCGGPSLEMCKQELIEAYWKGGKVVTTNGAFQWCIKNNIRVSATIMLDAREFNARFAEPVVPLCKYILAAQCHPSVFDMCRDREVWIWHAISAMDAELELLKEYYRGYFWPVSHGTTVGIRAISILQMLGFYSIDIFGLDSCWFDSRHHAYRQSENDDEASVTTWLRPAGRDDLAKPFECSPWMMKQAMDFQELLRDKADLFRLNVHGPGLIAEILRTGAQLEPLDAPVEQVPSNWPAQPG